MAEETQKIADTFALLAPQGAKKKSMILTPSPKGYVKL